MNDVREQLERLGRRGRWLLVSQRVLQWTAAVIAAAVVLAVLDYLLRLPGVVRLMLGASAVAVAGVWLFTRVRRAAAFRPAVSELALRIERMYPHLDGLLASAVDLAAAEPELSSHGRAMADRSVARARDAVSEVELHRLIDPTRTLRRAVVCLIAAGAVAAVVLVAPEASATAASRWVKPFGDTEWPRRVNVELAEAPAVLPIDAAIPVEASVHRGDREGLAVRLDYRFVTPGEKPAAWRNALMSRQGDRRAAEDDALAPGVYQAVIDPPARLARRLADEELDAATLEYRVTAGDDATETRTLRLAARPAVERVVIDVTPPDYAAGLLEPRTIEIDPAAGSVAAIAARVGSRIDARFAFHKPVAPDRLDRLGDHLPGLAAAMPGDALDLAFDNDAEPRELRATFTLRGDVSTTLHAVDRHGLALADDRAYRLDATPDAPPSAAITRPRADRSVLPAAVIDLAAVGRDDLGLVSLDLEARLPAPDAESGAEDTDAVETRTLAKQTGRRAELSLNHTLDLATLRLSPGDEVVLTAVARDAFDLDGETHEPAESLPRRLRVIDAAELMSRVRSDLAALRQRAVRMEQDQRRLRQSPVELAGRRQPEITRRAEAGRDTLDDLEARLDQNRMDAPAIRELIDASRGQLQAAADASREAAQGLDRPDPTDEQVQQARAAQDEARDRLAELIDMLDQGADALSLRLELDRLKALQEAVAQETRRLLPRTVGRDAEDLPEDLKQALENLAQRQADLAEQARQAVRQLQSTASALSRQSESDRDQATAEALAEAAAVAQRQGLDQTMRQARRAVSENRLSSAGGDQDRALDTLEEMLEQVGSQQRRMREMLRRRLTELVERLRRLVERQGAELARLEGLGGGAEPAVWRPRVEEQTRIRRATMAVEVDAAKARETQAAAEVIGSAVAAQARAVLALQGGDAAGADKAERQALTDLEEALELIEAARAEQREDQTRQQREKLRKAYTDLADRQDALREAVLPLSQKARLDRRERATLIELGGKQQALQEEAAKLGEQVADTLVFHHMHQRIDRDAARAARLLQRGRAEDETLISQRNAAAVLRQMAAALEQDSPPEDFEGRQSSGGGGGGGQPPPLVPPLAELKLLRSAQAMILSDTAATQLAQRPAVDEPTRRRLMELSTQQKELADLGERLIQQMQQQQQQLQQQQQQVPNPEDAR